MDKDAINRSSCLIVFSKHQRSDFCTKIETVFRGGDD